MTTDKTQPPTESAPSSCSADILDDLYSLPWSDRCMVFVAALRNLQEAADQNGMVTREEIDQFLKTAAEPYWAPKCSQNAASVTPKVGTEPC